MEKNNKETQIRTLLNEGKSVKEIEQLTGAHFTYVYAIKRKIKADK